jgi:hypothetical protein
MIASSRVVGSCGLAPVTFDSSLSRAALLAFVTPDMGQQHWLAVGDLWRVRNAEEATEIFASPSHHDGVVNRM